MRGIQILGPLGFVVGSLIFYWSGWDINRWMAGLLIAGAIIYVVYGLRRMDHPVQDIKSGLWLAAYFAFMLAVAYLGSSRFGGINAIPAPWDQIAVAVASLAFYYWGVASRRTLSLEEIRMLRSEPGHPGAADPGEKLRELS